jgi:hypothetical protein
MLVTAAAEPGEGEASYESSEYIRTPRLICRRLSRQVVRRALLLAAPIAGNSNAATMAMMAMTTMKRSLTVAWSNEPCPARTR